MDLTFLLSQSNPLTDAGVTFCPLPRLASPAFLFIRAFLFVILFLVLFPLCSPLLHLDGQNTLVKEEEGKKSSQEEGRHRLAECARVRQAQSMRRN